MAPAAALGKVLGAWAYAVELVELSYQAPQTGVRWNDTISETPQSSCLVGFAARCCGSDPVAFSEPCLCRRMQSTRGLLRRGSPWARLGSLIPWILRAIAGGYPMRVGTVLAYRGTQDWVQSTKDV